MNTKKRKRYRWRPQRTALALLFMLALLFTIQQGTDRIPEMAEKGIAQVKSLFLSSVDAAAEAPAEEMLLPEELASRNAILVRLDDEKVLLEKKSEERIYPASLTKIMTVLVAVEEIDDLGDCIELPEDIFPELYASNASLAGFEPGEEVSAKDLLYGSLLPSGAEASIGLAILTAGSEENFVELMNEKAKMLGMDDTRFANATGLHDDQHYTTAADLVLLLCAALENEAFREVFTAKSHCTKGSGCHPEGMTFYSTMFSKMEQDSFEGGKILGGKTGYTKEAGLCLASLAEKNGEEYILITAGAPGDHDTQQYNILDSLLVYDEI